MAAEQIKAKAATRMRVMNVMPSHPRRADFSVERGPFPMQC
jgi:hypothetical protein